MTLRTPLPSAKEILLTDVRYSAWANERVLDACSALSTEELQRDLKNSHISILGTLRHIYDSERVWLDCLGTSRDPGPWVLPQGDVPELSFDALSQNWSELRDGYRHLMEELSEVDLAAELIVELPDRVEPRFPRWKILRHVLNHSTLHRGQIVSMIRTFGRQPPQTDVLSYYFAA
jgi:uncharacterized damage-inducible protein DinB